MSHKERNAFNAPQIILVSLTLVFFVLFLCFYQANRSSRACEERKPRVCCLVQTTENNKNKMQAIYETWITRCDRYYFAGNKADANYPIFIVENVNSYDDFWQRTTQEMKYIYENNMLQDCDWVFKSDDEIYLIVEHLREFLKDKNASESIYYGFKFDKQDNSSNVSGGLFYYIYDIVRIIKTFNTRIFVFRCWLRNQQTSFQQFCRKRHGKELCMSMAR